MSEQHNYSNGKLRVLLLEKIHPIAVQKLESGGYSVSQIPSALDETDLFNEIKDIHILGIRSKTRVNAKHIEAAEHLLAIGTFGVGTNHIALDSARSKGIPVFNAPYGTTRSVAELTLGAMIMLSRKAADRNNKLHKGIWEKSANGCCEIYNKTVGIIGYGQIGQRVGLLAEGIGMRVIYFDPIKRQPLGRAVPANSMELVLRAADFVTLHIPALENGETLLTSEEISKMRTGSYLLNLSRGNLIDFVALRHAIEAKHLAGAAIDVFPNEPKTNSEKFFCELAGLENVFLTPHLGGSTEEAQKNIGAEVSTAIMNFISTGDSSSAINFPQDCAVGPCCEESGEIDKT